MNQSIYGAGGLSKPTTLQSNNGLKNRKSLMPDKDLELEPDQVTEGDVLDNDIEPEIGSSVETEDTSKPAKTCWTATVTLFVITLMCGIIIAAPQLTNTLENGNKIQFCIPYVTVGTRNLSSGTNEQEVTRLQEYLVNCKKELSDITIKFNEPDRESEPTVTSHHKCQNELSDIKLVSKIAVKESAIIATNFEKCQNELSYTKLKIKKAEKESATIVTSHEKCQKELSYTKLKLKKAEKESATTATSLEKSQKKLIYSEENVKAADKQRATVVAELESYIFKLHIFSGFMVLLIFVRLITAVAT